MGLEDLGQLSPLPFEDDRPLREPHMTHPAFGAIEHTVVESSWGEVFTRSAEENRQLAAGLHAKSVGKPAVSSQITT